MPSLFSKMTSLGTGFRGISADRNTVVFGAVVLLCLLALVLAGIDGYALYLSHFREDVPVAPLRNAVSFSTQDIDGVLNLLDEREEKIRALLGGE